MAEVDKVKFVQINIKYDLWDEKYQKILFINDHQVDINKKMTKDEILKALRLLRLNNIFLKIPNQEDGFFYIEIEVMLNPINKEKMEEVRKWVAETSTTVPSDLMGAIARPLTSRLFADLFEQVVKGQANATTWRIQEKSTNFQWKDLREFKN